MSVARVHPTCTAADLHMKRRDACEAACEGVDDLRPGMVAEQNGILNSKCYRVRFYDNTTCFYHTLADAEFAQKTALMFGVGSVLSSVEFPDSPRELVRMLNDASKSNAEAPKR